MAGLNQSEAAPFGVNAEQLLAWAWATKSVRSWSGLSGGTTGIDDEYWKRALFTVGANIMGRTPVNPSTWVTGPYSSL